MNVIVVDTETANSLDDPIIYDIGWMVINLEHEKVFKSESFAVAEIFLDKELMSSAYYAEKVPKYWQSIKAGDRKLTRMRTIQKQFEEDYEIYNVSEIYAHNARFDYKACNTTKRYMTCSKYRYFFPYGAKICDTLKMARQWLKGNEEYTKFCIENEYRTKNNQNRLTAEVIYRYLTQNTDFEEKHMGLEDVEIEKDILLACRRNGILDGALWD